MKAIFIGCVKFSKTTLEFLISNSQIEICGVITKRESDFNSDFFDLSLICKLHHIKFIYVESNQSENILDFIKESKADIIFCFGWSYLLSSEILKSARLGLIGYHPAALPKNRGRHPIIWALILGLKETASTFFWMDQGADSGDILSQVKIPILETDSSLEIYEKLSKVALTQIEQFTKDFLIGKFQRTPQDNSISNYWRKRQKDDGKIDWRMTSKSIYNLVRALTYPYPGSHCLHKGSEVKIWKVSILDAFHQENIEPGKVLGIDNDSIIVKTSDGAVSIEKHEFLNFPSIGDYI